MTYSERSETDKRAMNCHAAEARSLARFFSFLGVFFHMNAADLYIRSSPS
jgi:hypothetical protein